MTKTETKNTAAAYIRATKARLQLADTTSERALIANDIQTLLAGPGATLLSDSQARNLQSIQRKAQA